MAEVVLGIGTSHSPHVSTSPELWYLHAERDRDNPQLDYQALLASAPPSILEELSPEVYNAKHDACQHAIAELGRALRDANPDVVVVIGDDQRELFLDECSPAFAIYQGHDIVDIPPAPETVHPSHKPALWSRHAATLEVLPGMPALAGHIAKSLSSNDFDVAVAANQAEGRSIGHAFTFVRLRLMGERVIPMVPVFINCYYPPNQPSPGRCFAFGRALRRAITSWESGARVAIVASGGLTHFVVDEVIDRQVLAAIERKQPDLLTALPADKLVSGSSEIRNWIAAAGALEDLPARVLNYTPAYRSPAGTGCGMAFVRWN